MAYLSENLAELWLIAAGFDDLLLNGETVDSEGYEFTIDATDENASWDHPEPVDTAVQRWMTDGAVASTQGHDNRTPLLQVRVSAATSSDLAAAEAALVKRSARPCLLKWVPPEGDPDAPASVFEVWTWHLEHSFDGGDERHLQRYYTLTFTAKPWVRSENLTVSTAPIPPGGPTTLSIDTCASVTGWTGSSPTSSGGAVRGSQSVTGNEPALVKLVRTGSVTGLSALPYLVVDASMNGGFHDSLSVQVNGTTLTQVAAVGTVGYYALPTGLASFTTLEVDAVLHLASPGSTGTIRLIVADVSATDTIGGIGSAKQLARSLDVGGSVKTSGSIQIASPSATALGTCLVYTRANDGSGYTPPMRQFRTTGNTVTPDATCVSGNHEAFVTTGASAGTITYTVPNQLLPEAQYVVAGRFLFSAVSTLTATVTAAVTGFPAVGVSLTGKVTSAGSLPTWAVLGSLSLPTQAMPPESQLTTTVTLSGTATASATVTLDELYLIDTTNGAMTLLTTGSTQLWLDAPDADPVRNRPAVYVGTQSDRSDAAMVSYTFVLSLGDHDLDPGGATLFTVTDGVNNAAASASFYRRWHTHAGD